MRNAYKVILVTFDLSSNQYSYVSDMPVENNDRVIVIVHDVAKVAKVTRTEGLTQSQIERATTLIHSVIGKNDYPERVERYHTYLEIKQELRQAKEEHDERYIYETLAKDNPVIEALLKRLDTLDTSRLLEEKKRG